MLAGLLAGCVASSDGAVNSTGDVPGGGPVAAAPVAATGKFRSIGTVVRNRSAYKLGPTDVLKISVFQVEELDREVIVTDAGTVNLPLIGAVRAGGRTLQEVEREITQKLRKFLRSPQVTVFVKQYNSQKYTVEGSVKQPGVFPIRGQVTLLQAIATARGLGKLADSSSIIMFRQVSGQKYAAKFDLNAIRLGKMPDPPIIKNDIIYVEESGSRRFFDQTKQWLGPASALIRLGVGF